MSIERQTAVALKWTGIAKFGGQVVTWAITLVVLRLLAPADYGLMALVSVVISVLMNVSEMGLGFLRRAGTAARRRRGRAL
jgi:O-antigen/teichoic acid export membrane protein